MDPTGSSSLQVEVLVPVTLYQFYKGMSKGKFYPSDSVGRTLCSFQRCTSFNVSVQIRVVFLK